MCGAECTTGVVVRAPRASVEGGGAHILFPFNGKFVQRNKRAASTQMLFEIHRYLQAG